MPTMAHAEAPETKWGRSCSAFERHADVGVLMFFLGGLAIVPALALMRESVAATVLVLVVALGLFAAGYVRNVRLGRRHLRCPHCEQYPFGESLLLAPHPLWTVREIPNRGCIQCHQPLGPRHASNP